MNVEQALDFLRDEKKIREVLQTLYDVGLSYIQLGQSALTLSGGEAQRIKLAKELGRPGRGHTLYLLDEPTTGLHFSDIQNLLVVLKRITLAGNTVIVVEHSPDIMANADWIIDLGPDGGNAGGTVVAQGTPEQVAQSGSHTGNVLKEFFI
jgi:excinuclease ABC subunit A